MTLNDPNLVLLYGIHCCHSLNKCGKYFVFPAKCVYILQVLEAKAALLLTSDTRGNETRYLRDAFMFDQKSKMFVID